MKTNKKSSEVIFTEEGGKANKTTPLNNLRRAVLSSFLFEDSFYENGVGIADRISQLIKVVPAPEVANLAVEARLKFNLRHMPLFLVRELARNNDSRYLVAEALEKVIQRPDELSEFLALYWKDKKQPLAASVKKGLARAFTKFNEYSLAKYNQDNEIKLRDVLFLCHAKPKDKEQEKLWKKLIDNKLETPDTWEVRLSNSKGQNKKEVWEELLIDNKMGALALLRNLRNFKENNVSEGLIQKALKAANFERVLPFRFVSAAKYYPTFEPLFEDLMIRNLANERPLRGRTALAIDVSGSMDMHTISAKSDLTRLDAACALAMLLRGVCLELDVYTFSKKCVQIAARQGFGLKELIVNSQPHKDTKIKETLEVINNKNYDRVIVLTDGQIEDELIKVGAEKKYMLNVANNKNGIGYKDGWNNIDGFSELVVKYITEIEDI